MSEHVIDFIEAYALGELDAGPSAFVRRHLEHCTACRAQYNDARAVFDLLPHVLEPVKPHDRVLQNILNRATPRAASPPRARFPAAAAIAAALVLALAGDVVMGTLLATRRDRTVALRATTPIPLRVAPTAPGPSRSHAHSASPVPLPQSAPNREHPVAWVPAVSPAVVPSTRASTPRELQVAATTPPRPAARDARARDVGRLQRERDEAIAALRIRSTQDAGRIAQLEHRLTTNGGSSRETALLAALQTGAVYAIKGTVDGEPWHCTVLQPSPTANAVLLTSAPSAPAGQEYRVWVIRDKRTYDAGTIAPRTSVALEMPMPLIAGDVVAFSREPESTGKLPTQPFLMQLPISN